MKKIAILNGPNLDRLGKREPEIYGRATLADLEKALRAEFGATSHLEFFQSNHEGALIDKVAALTDAKFDGLVINGGAFTHTSVALRAEFGATSHLEFFQSNHEGALIDKVATLTDAKFDGLVLNGGAFTHTSVALRDALLGAHLPTVEVHISNIYKREEFRHTSLTAPACIAVITGLGLEGYHAAVRFLLKL